MLAVSPIFCILLLLGGCRDQPDSKDAAVSAPTPSVVTSAVSPAGRPPSDDEPLLAIDDTLPTDRGVELGEEASEGDGPEAACAPEGSDLKPMQLLRFAFASDLEGKDPKDDLRLARPGQRIYAHLTVRNRSGRQRCLVLQFRVAGKMRTEVTVKVGASWSWRTWAYNTLKADDEGPLELTVKDDQGQVLFVKTLPVVPK